MARSLTFMAGVLAIALTGAALAQTPITLGQTVTGTLGPGDSQLPSGEYLDSYTFQAQPGQAISIRMNSTEIDTYIIFIDGAGQQQDNDDFQGTNSGLDITLTSGGTCQIGATSYAPGETGSYQISVTPAGAAPAAPAPTGAPGWGTPPAQPGMPATPPAPPTQPSGWGTPPAPPTPPATPATQPSGWGTPPAQPGMPATPPAPPTQPSGWGTPPAQPGMPAAPPGGPMMNGGPISVGQSVSGQLGPGDEQLTSGEYIDSYSVQLSAQQQIQIRLSSQQFDTYIILRDPNGSQQDNDDFMGTDSGIDLIAPAAGEYMIGVTSYAPGETGVYTLSVN